MAMGRNENDAAADDGVSQLTTAPAEAGEPSVGEPSGAGDGGEGTTEVPATYLPWIDGRVRGIIAEAGLVDYNAPSFEELAAGTVLPAHADDGKASEGSAVRSVSGGADTGSVVAMTGLPATVPQPQAGPAATPQAPVPPSAAHGLTTAPATAPGPAAAPAVGKDDAPTYGVLGSVVDMNVIVFRRDDDLDKALAVLADPSGAIPEIAGMGPVIRHGDKPDGTMYAILEPTIGFTDKDPDRRTLAALTGKLDKAGFRHDDSVTLGLFYRTIEISADDDGSLTPDGYVGFTVYYGSSSYPAQRMLTDDPVPALQRVLEVDEGIAELGPSRYACPEGSWPKIAALLDRDPRINERYDIPAELLAEIQTAPRGYYRLFAAPHQEDYLDGDETATGPDATAVTARSGTEPAALPAAGPGDDAGESTDDTYDDEPEMPVAAEARAEARFLMLEIGFNGEDIVKELGIPEEAVRRVHLAVAGDADEDVSYLVLDTERMSVSALRRSLANLRFDERTEPMSGVAAGKALHLEVDDEQPVDGMTRVRAVFDGSTKVEREPYGWWPIPSLERIRDAGGREEPDGRRGSTFLIPDGFIDDAENGRVPGYIVERGLHRGVTAVYPLGDGAFSIACSNPGVGAKLHDLLESNGDQGCYLVDDTALPYTYVVVPDGDYPDMQQWLAGIGLATDAALSAETAGILVTFEEVEPLSRQYAPVAEKAGLPPRAHLFDVRFGDDFRVPEGRFSDYPVPSIRCTRGMYHEIPGGYLWCPDGRAYQELVERIYSVGTMRLNDMRFKYPTAADRIEDAKFRNKGHFPMSLLRAEDDGTLVADIMPLLRKDHDWALDIEVGNGDLPVDGLIDLVTAPIGTIRFRTAADGSVERAWFDPKDEGNAGYIRSLKDNVDEDDLWLIDVDAPVEWKRVDRDDETFDPKDYTPVSFLAQYGVPTAMDPNGTVTGKDGKPIKAAEGAFTLPQLVRFALISISGDIIAAAERVEKGEPAFPDDPAPETDGQPDTPATGTK